MKMQALKILAMANEVILTRTDNMKICDTSIDFIKLIDDLKSCLNQLRDLLRDKKLSQEDEIFIFKHIKSEILSKQIYFSEIYKMNLHVPNGDIEAKKDFYKNKIRDIHLFYDNNKECYVYYRSKSTNKDQYYFTRANIDFDNTLGNIIIDRYPDFSTSYDNKHSAFIAYEMVEKYLHKKLSKLDNDINSENIEISPNYKQFNWTGKKIDLVELAYSLYVSNCINNGNISIKEIIDSLELIFNIDIGDYYREYFSIKNRKNNRTPFIDYLKTSLIRKMDNEDKK